MTADTDRSKDGRPSGAAWRSEPLVAWPRYARAAALGALLALGWLAAETLYSTPEVPALEDGQRGGTPGSAASREAPDPSSFEPALGARKLFIPEVPVESHEMSGERVDSILARLKLRMTVERDGEYVAWIEVSQTPTGNTAANRPGQQQQPGATKSVPVRKGDEVEGFKVEEVTSAGVRLSIAGFERRLTF